MFGLDVRRVDFITGLGFSIWSALTGKLKWLLFNFCPTVFVASLLFLLLTLTLAGCYIEDDRSIGEEEEEEYSR